MANYTISAIQLPNGDTCSIRDTTYDAATTSAAGLMSASDKSKLDGIAAGAQVNAVTGVKGNSESSYRVGDVNITLANLGYSVASTSDVESYLEI